MPPSPVPADPGWDEDLAWLDRDPEREVWRARAREHDEPPGEEEEFADFASLTAEAEAELVGVLCAWDRMEAHAHARKLAAIGELARRNPGELDQEFTADSIAYALGESRARADSLIGMAQAFGARLPGTAAALADGMVSRYKAEIIARATVLLEDEEARAAEAEVLDRAARLTPGALRAAIARAVVAVAQRAAQERRG